MNTIQVLGSELFVADDDLPMDSDRGSMSSDKYLVSLAAQTSLEGGFKSCSAAKRDALVIGAQIKLQGETVDEWGIRVGDFEGWTTCPPNGKHIVAAPRVISVPMGVTLDVHIVTTTYLVVFFGVNWSLGTTLEIAKRGVPLYSKNYIPKKNMGETKHRDVFRLR